MLKVRYFKLRLPISITEFGTRARRYPRNASDRLDVVRERAGEIVLSHTTIRHLTVTRLSDDGAATRESVPTYDQASLRLFTSGGRTFLSILNPGRSVKSFEAMLQMVLGGLDFFYEPLEITKPLIERHVAKFTASKLVSAKVRDFRVEDDAIGRLEVSSKSGLKPTIAPFLEGRFHRIDALAYEVTHDMTKGLIWYSSAGSVRVSEPLVEIAFPLFEQQL
jgi:hypothetical protein